MVKKNNGGKERIMKRFFFENTKIEGLMKVNPFYVEDERGYFLKNYEKEIFMENGIYGDIDEQFESLSKKGVIRGLHFQSKYPQDKLVRAIKGKIFDVAVDLRKDSKTFGQWEGFWLSEDNKNMLLVPKGCAHGFLAVSDEALVSYTCIGKFLSEFDTGIIWNDKDLKISWPLDLIENLIISERDKSFTGMNKFIDEVGGINLK